MIDNAQDDGEPPDGQCEVGTLPFTLWPAQVLVLWQLMRNRLVVILKARQLGITWLVCGYALWLCMFRPNRLVLAYSKGESEAKGIIRRIKVLYQRLPRWLQQQCPMRGKPGTEQLEWVNGSRVVSLPATEDAGRSETASLVIMDEFAIPRTAKHLLNAAKPTIDGGGQLIILSTARGVGNTFHAVWDRAKKGLNGFLAIFLPWWARPGRDAAWHAAKMAESDDPALVKQEYPANDREAFVASGRVRFAPAWCDAQESNLRTAIPPEELAPGLRGDGLRIYARPTEHRDYVLSADVAEGLEHGDYSDAVLFDRKTWEEVARLRGHWEPDDFANRLHALAEAYAFPTGSKVTIVVERNNHGHAVLLALKKLGSTRIANGHDGRPGWLSNPKTKPQAIDALAVALRDVLCVIHSEDALGEMRLYQKEPNGKTCAPSGFHDDAVMAWAVGLGWLQLCGSRRAFVIAYDDD